MPEKRWKDTLSSEVAPVSSGQFQTEISLKVIFQTLIDMRAQTHRGYKFERKLSNFDWYMH